MDIRSIEKNIATIAKCSKAFMRGALKKHGFNLAEAQVLVLLYEKVGGSTQESMIAGLNFNKGVMTRTTQSLEKQGYIQRSDNPNDKRSYIFSLTEKGEAVKPALLTIVAEWQNRMTVGVDNEALEQIIANFEILANNASKGSRR